MATFKTEDGTEVEAFTSDEVKDLISKEVGGLKAKNDELLGKLSDSKTAMQEVQAAQDAAELERQKEKGEFKSLYEKTLADLEGEREQARTFKTQVQSKELDGEAFKLASQLTTDTARADLLKKEALQFAKYTDEGVQFEIGGVVVAQDKLLEKMRTDYPFLVDGSGANGGGAKGATNGQRGEAAQAGTLFKDMTPEQRVQYLDNNPPQRRQ